MGVAHQDHFIAHPNHLLASLPAADFALLRPHLRTIDLVHEVVLFEAGDPVEQVYFPHSGVISLVVELADGEMIETSMIGHDSIVWASSALDGKVSLNKGIVQISGVASTLNVGRLRNFAEQRLAFHTTLIRLEQVLFAQAQQSAACNASHILEARLARWLLRARDLSASDTLLLT